MSNLIFNAFAFKEEYLTSPQVGGKVSEKTIDIYMKNIYLSLSSAKRNNPQDEVALITNYTIPVRYTNLLANQNIKIIKIEFDEYIMPKTFVWSLAYFKLCALKYIVNNTDYENILLLDSDTITVRNYIELWLEAKQGLLLYNVNHSYNHKDRRKIVDDYQRIYNDDKNIIHYGGEFICGTNIALKKFIEKCDDVYNIIKKNGFNISEDAGDETIISIAATSIDNVIEAGAYIYRYWTGRFYLVSTNYINNAVCIWHIPNEKKSGIIKIYKKYLNRTPSIKEMAKILGFPNERRPFYLLYIIKKILIEMKLNK